MSATPLPRPPAPSAAPQRMIFTKPAFEAEAVSSPMSQKFGALITEIAARLEPLAVILNRYGVTKTQWAALQAQPWFEKTLQEQARAFGAISNVGSRVKMKAQLLTEILLDDMHGIASHPIYPASARVSAFAQIKALTGLDKPDDVAPQRQFSLTINLGDGRVRTAQTVTIEAERVRDASGNETFADEGQFEEIQTGEEQTEVGGDAYEHDASDLDGVDRGERGAAGGDAVDVAVGDGGSATPVRRLTWNSFTATQGPTPDAAGEPHPRLAGGLRAGAASGEQPTGPSVGLKSGLSARLAALKSASGKSGRRSALDAITG